MNHFWYSYPAFMKLTPNRIHVGFVSSSDSRLPSETCHGVMRVVNSRNHKHSIFVKPLHAHCTITVALVFFGGNTTADEARVWLRSKLLLTMLYILFFVVSYHTLSVTYHIISHIRTSYSLLGFGFSQQHQIFIFRSIRHEWFRMFTTGIEY